MATVLWPTIAIVLGAALSFLAAFTLAKRKERRETEARDLLSAQALQDRLAVMEKQLALVGQAVVPISTAFQAILIKELTHYHAPVLDELLLKIGPPSTLSPEEFAALQEGLEIRTKDMHELISDSERDAAIMLPLVMKRAQTEYDAMSSIAPLVLQFVTMIRPENKTVIAQIP